MKTLQVPMYASWSLTFALLGDTFLYTFLPVHAGSVNVPLFWVGVLLSINRFVRIGLTPWMASLFHRVGFRTLSIGAAMGAILTTLGYGMGWGVAGWLLLRIVWGLSFAILRIASLRYALDHPRVGFSLGVSRSIIELGPLAALLIGPWVLAYTNPTWAFAILALGSIPTLWFALRLPERQDDPPTAPRLRFTTPSLVNGLTFLSSFAVEGMVVVVAGVLLLQSSPHITVATVTAWVAGYLLFRRISAIVLSPASGWLADRYGFEKVYAASLGFIALGLFILSMDWITAGLLLLFTFHSVNASLAVGATSRSEKAESSATGASTGKTTSTHAVAENAAWRDAGAAIGALAGGFLLSSPWVQLILALSSILLLVLLCRYVKGYCGQWRIRLEWK